MKKTVFRSLIVGLFAFVSLNASAGMNWDYLQENFETADGNLPGFHVSCQWLDAYSGAQYVVDAFPYDEGNVDHTGELVRVVWGPYFYESGFYPGDCVYVRGSDGNYTEIWLGTNAIYQTIIPVSPDGTFDVFINSGSTAGYRYFGGGPIVFWPLWLEFARVGGEPNWNVVWGWATY